MENKLENKLENPDPEIDKLFPVLLILATFINCETGIMPAASLEIKADLNIDNF